MQRTVGAGESKGEQDQQCPLANHRKLSANIKDLREEPERSNKCS